MPQIRFKAKLQTVYNHDDTIAYQYVGVPRIARSHCDMAAFRSSPKFGAYANSDMFLAIVAREFRALGIGGMIKLGELPECATIDASGFLAVVTIELCGEGKL